jgi:hypothetical protein
MTTTTVTDAEILAAVEGPPSLRPKPTDQLRSTIARQRAGQPVDDLLELFRRMLVTALRQRNGYTEDFATTTAAACERAIRAELDELTVTNRFEVGTCVTVLIAADGTVVAERGADVREACTRIQKLTDGQALLLVPGDPQTRWVDVADLIHTYPENGGLNVMRTVTVVFELGATSAVTVDVPDDAGTETMIEAAGMRLDASLCHQCSHAVTLGDGEPIVIDEDGEEVWTAEDEANTAAVERFRAALAAAVRGAEAQAMGLGSGSDGWLTAMADFIADFELED